jgi:hypothetical protein
VYVSLNTKVPLLCCRNWVCMLFVGLCCRSFLRSKRGCGAQRQVSMTYGLLVCGMWYRCACFHVYRYIVIHCGVCVSCLGVYKLSVFYTVRWFDVDIICLCIHLSLCFQNELRSVCCFLITRIQGKIIT